MNWECTECGSWVRTENSPNVCPKCGVAGAVFVLLGSDEDAMVETFGGVWSYWYDLGLSPEQTASQELPDA